MSENRHLAQLNIGRLRYPTNDPRMADLRQSICRAKERLEHLAAHGPSDYAFGWESVPAAQLWKTARCAPDEQAA